MSLINYDRLFAALLSQEQDLANELLALSRQERICREANDTDRLVDIVAQRNEVTSAWETHHQETLAVAHCCNLNDSPAKTELQNAINRLNETITAINAEDQSSPQKLTDNADQDLDGLQNLNQGSQLQQYLNQPLQSFVHDIRQ